MPASAENKVLMTGIFGSLIAAICCFTPILVVTFAAIGLSAVIGWLDYVLLPALALFLAVTGYGMWLKATRRES